MNDFLKTNFHTHTARCMHAEGSDREYVLAAIKAGIRKLGFSDHIPCDFKDGYVSGIRMRMEEAPEYVRSIQSLRDEFRDQIEILIGFEAEYIPEFFEEQKLMCRELGIDYLIMGQHFWNRENKGPYSGSPTEDEARIRQYVDSVIAGMETGMYKYLAHPDLINYQGLDSVYEWEMTRLCRAMKELEIPLEINLLGIHEERNYPNETFWRIASEIGNRVIIGIDAHSPGQFEDREAYRRAMEIVKRYDLKVIEDWDIVLLDS